MNQVGSGSGVSDWVKAHEALTRIAKERAELDSDEGAWLLQALRTEAHRHLGFGTFSEYVERLLGYGPRQTEEKVRVAEALEGLPEIERALRHGEIHWSAARELSRVATPNTEKAWLSAAHGKTSRQLERLVAGRKPGDRPSDPARADAKLHVLRFEVHAETFALFRDAVAHVRRRSDTALDDDALLLLLAREILNGPSDDGRSSYQVAVTTCDRCQQTFQQGAGELIPVEPEVAAMAACDAQHLPPHVGPDRAVQGIPPATRRRVMRRDHGRCVVPGCRHAIFVDVHHLCSRSDGGSHRDSNLIVLCAAHHRAIHRGSLIVEGTPETGLRFFHADGQPYGTPRSAPDSDAVEKAFLGLRRLGFSQRDCRRALDRAKVEPGLHFGRAAHPFEPRSVDVGFVGGTVTNRADEQRSLGDAAFAPSVRSQRGGSRTW